MSEIPLMTPQQANKSISAKKSKKKPLKHVLLTPHITKWLMVASSNENEAILDIIRKFPKLVPEKIKIPWKTIETIPKNERKSFRAKFQNKIQPIDQKQEIILGINQVTKYLEANKVIVILLTSDIKPFYMVQHIVDLCSVHNIPVLIVADLRKALNDTLGIASTCIGIKINTNTDILVNLCQCVMEIWKNNRHDERCIILDDTVAEDDELVQKVDAQCTTSNQTDKESMKEADLKNVHLIRTNLKSRVFVPKRTHKNNALNADFIRFTAPEPVVSKEYVGLQVAKMISNSKRIVQSKRIAQGKLQPNKLVPNTKKTKLQRVS